MRIDGFTLIEVIIAVIIISILTLVLVPQVSQRSQQARIATTQKEVNDLCQALERFAIDTNYYVRLDVLDDVYGGNNVANTITGDRIDGTRDELIDAGNLHVTPSQMFINTRTQKYDDNSLALVQRFIGSQSGNLRAETDFGWVGPYITWKKDANNNDWPDDAWGHDYILFTRAGALFAPSPNFDDSEFETDPLPDGPSIRLDQIFDRPTILSLGPDGLPGDGTDTDTDNDIFGLGDDIFRSFGG